MENKLRLKFGFKESTTALNWALQIWKKVLAKLLYKPVIN